MSSYVCTGLVTWSYLVTSHLVKSDRKDIPKHYLCFVIGLPKTSSFWLSAIGNKMFYFNVNFLIPNLNKITKNVTDEESNDPKLRGEKRDRERKTNIFNCEPEVL